MYFHNSNLCHYMVIGNAAAVSFPTFTAITPPQIPGNKMTAANLAVIFGPNLLQREGGGDTSPQAMGIEDSTAIISITLVLIQNYRRLFTVREESHPSSETLERQRFYHQCVRLTLLFQSFRLSWIGWSVCSCRCLQSFSRKS